MSVRSRDFIYPLSFLMIYSVTIIFTFFFSWHPSLSSSPGISCFHFWLLSNVFSELDHDDGDHLILLPTSYALHWFHSWWWRLQPESNEHLVYSWSSSSWYPMMMMEEEEISFRVCFSPHFLREKEHHHQNQCFVHIYSRSCFITRTYIWVKIVFTKISTVLINTEVLVKVLWTPSRVDDTLFRSRFMFTKDIKLRQEHT